MRASKKILKTVLLISTLLLLSFDLPKDWWKAGEAPDNYYMGIDKVAGHSSTDTFTIQYIGETPKGFGTLMTICSAEKYLGKRIRMKASLKSKNITTLAGMWLRVDQAKKQEPLAFDNMQGRPITGTTDWTNYEIVLDVPNNASQLAYGVLLESSGQVWFENLTFEIVDNSVKVTDMIKKETIIPYAPDYSGSEYR